MIQGFGPQIVSGWTFLRSTITDIQLSLSLSLSLSLPNLLLGEKGYISPYQ